MIFKRKRYFCIFYTFIDDKNRSGTGDVCIFSEKGKMFAKVYVMNLIYSTWKEKGVELVRIMLNQVWEFKNKKECDEWCYSIPRENANEDKDKTDGINETRQ